MAKIDTSEWGSFVIGDLFIISRPEPRSQASYTDGDVPFVASGNYNNGVVKYCMPMEDETLDEKNCITVSPLDGSTFYQPQNFLGRGGAGSAIVILRNPNLNDKNGLFLATAIRDSLTKYTYADQLNSRTIASESIKLPIKNGQPDWGYMDSYMTKIIHESETYLANFRKADEKKCAVNTKKWKEFIVGELFPSMVKPPVLHTRQVIEADEGIPYVVRTKFNNGIKYRIYPVTDVSPSPAGVITWGAENATFFYQTEEFFSGRDIYYIDTRKYSANTCMFICACLQTIAHKYPYNYGLFPKLLMEECIKLPVNISGEPDWVYMDSYMQKVMQTSESNFNALNEIFL